MKRLKISHILILFLALCIAGFFAIHVRSSSRKISGEKACSLYESSAKRLDLASITYQITETKSFLLNKEITFTKLQKVNYHNKDSAEFSGIVSEDIQIGDHSVQNTAFLSNDTFYFQTGDVAFSSPMTQDTFLDRYTPFLLIDPLLYTTIYGIQSNGESTLYFTEASEPEAWTKLENVEFISAEGVVVIDSDDNPKEFRYTCEYIANSIQIKLCVTTAAYSNPNDLEISGIPANAIAVSEPTAAMYLDIACGYLLSGMETIAEYTDEIYCQAFDDRRLQTISLKTTSTEAKVNTDITLQNSSKVGPQTDIHKEETYCDGLYTIRINDSDPTTDPQITWDKMQEYYQSILIGTIMLPNHISKVDLTQSDNSITYTFTGNESFANTLRGEACNTLYQNPNILDDQTQSYTTETATFYIEIDSTTQLPKASGFLYQGVYTNDGLPYRLDYRAEQTYELQ